MVCCLNPGCKLENPPCPDAVQYCTSCGTKLVLLSDRYCPVSRIGEGGFGVTYLAQDRQRFNKDCVIKQLIVHNSKAKELFEQEAKQLEHLGSQCSQIPRLLAYPSDNQYLYLVQEFIAGQNLEKYLADKGTQNEEQIKDFLNTLLPVLDLIHKNKIIHRDIKLDNIMRRDDGQLVLIDFGVAKQFIDNNTPIPGTIAGTPGYAPSEQMIQGIAYPSSDLYSLGAACFHLLTGKHPYKAYEVHDFKWTSKWRQYLQQPISNELGKILDKMLQEKYQNRYQSAGDVIRALQNLKLLNPAPQQTVPVNPSVHLTHKTAWLNFYAALIGVVVVLAGGALTIINQQPKNPIVPISQTNSTASTEADDKNAQKPIDKDDKIQQQITPSLTKSPIDNKATAGAYYKRGQELAGKDNKGAIEAFAKAIELDSNNGDIYNARGVAKSKSGDNNGAIEDYNRAIKLKVDFADAYYNRGYAWIHSHLTESNHNYTDNCEKALNDYTEAIQIDPTDALAYNNRGINRSSLGDDIGAIADYDKAIKLKPNNALAYSNRGNIYLKKGDLAEAIKDYNRAIVLKPSYSFFYANLAVALSRLGDNTGAIANYDKAIKLEPNNYYFYLDRSDIKSKIGDENEAIKDRKQASNLNENNMFPPGNKGHTHDSFGDNRRGGYLLY
jgi:serine/threonine protein kinase